MNRCFQTNTMSRQSVDSLRWDNDTMHEDHLQDAILEDRLYDALRTKTDAGLREVAAYLSKNHDDRLSPKTQIEMGQLLVRLGVSSLNAALKIRNETLAGRVEAEVCF